MKAIVFDFGNVLGFFDHQRTLTKLTPFTDMSPAEMLMAVYGAELEDAFESGQVSAAEFLRQYRERCRLNCAEEFLRAAVADIFQPNEPVCALVPRLKAAGYTLLPRQQHQRDSRGPLPPAVRGHAPALRWAGAVVRDRGTQTAAGVLRALPAPDWLCAAGVRVHRRSGGQC